MTVLLTSGLVVAVIGLELKLGLWRTSVRLEMLPLRLCPLPCLTCVGREDDAEVTDCCCGCCDCHIAFKEGVLGLEEMEGDSFECGIIDWKVVLDRGEAGLLLEEFRSESNVSEPCRSSVGVYLPFKLLDRNPPGPMERGVPVRDGCFAVEALESRRANEELVTFTVLLKLPFRGSLGDVARGVVENCSSVSRVSCGVMGRCIPGMYPGIRGVGDILFEASCISGDNRVEGCPTPLSSWDSAVTVKAPSSSSRSCERNFGE